MIQSVANDEKIPVVTGKGVFLHYYILLGAKKLDYLMMSEEERRAYDNYLAYLGQELGILDTAKSEGRAEGREEEKIEIAGKLLNENIPIQIVEKITELPLATIQQLTKD